MRSTLAPPATLTFDTSVVRGEPAPALLALAQQARADFVALGTQHHTLMERLMVGSVATRVLRTARIPVLAVPKA
jgi:nucleotide-binding universal stress UspA family protein